MFSYTEWALTLLKAAGHKYIKRIPYQSGGRLRYRYIYNVTHTHQGKHVLDPDHMQVGTKLMLDATSGKEVHGHITDVRGDLVSFEYDDGPRKGEVVTMGKERLAAELDKVHGISGKLSEARAKQKAVVDKLKERGASDKQIAREQRRLDALGAEPKKVEPKKAEPKKAEPKKDEPKKPSKKGDAEDALRFYDTEGATELYKALYDSYIPSREDAEYARAVSQIKSTKKSVISASGDPSSNLTYDQKSMAVFPAFSNDDLIVAFERSNLIAVPQGGPFKGYAVMLGSGLDATEAKILLHELGERASFHDLLESADVSSEESLKAFQVPLRTASREFRDKMDAQVRTYKLAKRSEEGRASVTRIAEADIKGEGAPVVQATASYESGEAIPPKAQSTLKKLIDPNRKELSVPFYQNGHVYGGSGYLMARVKVDQGQEGHALVNGKMTASGVRPPPVSKIFPTDITRLTTINEQEAKDLAHALKGVLSFSTPVRLETSGGVTRVSIEGKQIGEFPSHITNAPSVSIAPQNLRNMLLSGSPITLGHAISEGVVHAENASMELISPRMKET